MTDFFKMAEFIFNYIIGQRQSLGARSQEISAEILNQIRRVLILVMVTIGALTLFCMGVSHLIQRILDNMDEGKFVFTPSIWAILAFLIICVSILIYSTNKRVWLKMFEKEKEEVKLPSGFFGGQLESVISLLVLDILKEREANREKSRDQRHEHNHSD
jgi:uncharacterized membrane protein YidH (DUF202 family)